eukprot:scaffold10.g2380.t1
MGFPACLLLQVQSAVLRSVFLSTDRGGWAAAVEVALAGASLRHATLCLRLAYAPHPLEALAALGVPEPEWAAALEGALRLADKLDMPLVMKPHVMPKTPHYNTLGSHVLLRSDVDVARWLVLATQTGLRTLEERCVRRLLGSLLRGEPLLHATRGELAPQAGGLLAALAVMEGPFRQMRAHMAAPVRAYPGRHALSDGLVLALWLGLLLLNAVGISAAAVCGVLSLMFGWRRLLFASLAYALTVGALDLIPLKVAPPAWLECATRRYFLAYRRWLPVSMVFEDAGAFKPGQAHMVAYEPHSVMPLVGVWWYVGGWVLWAAISRNLLWWIGLRPASRSALHALLAKGGLPHRVKECGVAGCGGDVERVYLRQRKGFVRLALQHGAPLVPFFSFGQVPCTIVVGAPILLPRVAAPPAELVDATLQRFVVELQALFERHKGEAGYPRARLEVH